MRNPHRRLAILLVGALTLISGLNRSIASNEIARAPHAQQTTSALERGFRTGYSDGYQAGYRDVVDNAARDYRSKEDYRRADRAYADSYGALEDYRDGYRQGFEIGYGAGYERREFNPIVPTGLARRSTTTATNDTLDRDDASQTSGATDAARTATTIANSPSGASLYIPVNTVMRVELLTNLSTEASQRGDSFQARVVEPTEYQGAIIDGHIATVKRPGRVRGTAEMQLSFDRITLPDNRRAPFSAQVIEVLAARGEVGRVDPEGGVRGKDSKGDDVARIGAGTGVGAIIGAIAGGGRGAAIGAAIGGIASTGGVLATRGKELRLPRGQQLRIRTANEARVQ